MSVIRIVKKMQQLIKLELLLARRQLAEVSNPLLFNIIVVSLFPLAITPDSHTLHTIAPGIIWVAALLAALLSFDRLFRSDYEDGSLEQLILQPYPLAAMLSAKIISHWLISGLPLIIIAPLLAMMLQMTLPETQILLISLLLGTPVLSFLGAIIAALTVTLRASGVLLTLLLLPLTIPVLIFGAGSVVMVSGHLPVQGLLLLLGAMLVLTITIAPIICAAALRIGMSQ